MKQGRQQQLVGDVDVDANEGEQQMAENQAEKKIPQQNEKTKNSKQ